MKRWLTPIFAFFLLTFAFPVHAAFFDRDSCDEIPIDQRVAEGTMCLQRTGAAGRTAGVTYVWDGTTWRQDANIPRVTVAGRPTSPKNADVIVVTDALNSTTCITGGGTSNNSCQWNGSAWVAIGGGGGGGGTPGGLDTQVQYNSGGAFAGDPGLTYNAVTDTLTVVGNVSVAGQSVCRADGTNCPGAGSFQPLDADLTALAGNSTAGFWAAATNAARSFANGTGITWTNPAGVAGNPQANVTSTVVMTDRASTWTTGDVNMRNALSFTMPNATGANPTTPGTCAFDLTAQTYKCGLTNGSTVTLATTGLLSAYQPLSNNLTAFSNLVGVNGKIPYFTAAGAMALTSGLETPCVDTGGQHLNLSSIGTFTCGTSSTSGLSGGTINYGIFAAGATSIVSSDALQLDGSNNVWAKNGLVVGTGNSLVLDTSAIAASNKTWTVLNFDGTVRVSTGAFISGNVVKTNANGLLVDGGVAGSGDAFQVGPNTFTNTTLNVEATGNVITTVSKVWLVAAGGTVAAPGLMWDALATNAPTAVCSAGTTETTMLRCTADFPDSDGDYSLQQTLMLPSDWTGAVDALIKYRTTATSGNTIWQVATACRADAEVDDVAFNAASVSAADAAKGTTNQLNDVAITGITMTGCAAGELMHLKILRNRTHASDTMTGVVSLVGVEMTTRRAQ